MSKPNSRSLSSVSCRESDAQASGSTSDSDPLPTAKGNLNKPSELGTPGRVSDLFSRGRHDRRTHKQSRERPFQPNGPRETPPCEVQTVVAPQIIRASMRANIIERNPFRTLLRFVRRKFRTLGTPGHARQGAVREASWLRAARLRRTILFILVALQTAVATWSLSNAFPYPWLRESEIAILTLFAILFSWISLGFWSALAGFWTLLRDSTTEFSATNLPVDQSRPLKTRTAVLMPICNEDVDRVFAGLEATYRSLAQQPEFSSFDFFVLSDTAQPQKQVQEEIAWARTCEAVQGFGRIFYRHRRNNVRRKSGNIADFLRRWGRKYDYMIVFDADSVMAGETLVRLAQMMEHYPQAGIIQTVPTTINCDSLFGRVQQFAGRAYGRMLTAGQRFWQLGEGYYWGHNAIIRVAPFMRHCGLSRLPGEAPLGGEILSHDFVEAALMGRAGWDVWVVHDLPGSYEESPPTLADELKRDRRWCQGNLQHMRLLFGNGLRFGHRAIFAMGIMAYASALFWFIFLMLNTVELAAQAYLPTVYFSDAPSLFPLWPRWKPEWAIALLTTTAILLFLPKILSFLIIVRNRQASLFGGVIPLLASICLEIVLSTLLAPIRMWFHSQFVLVTLMGSQIKWGPQFRTDNETRWSDAIRLHGFGTVLALAWMGGLYWLAPALTVWLLPVGISLAVAVPVSVYSSRLGLGRALRRLRLFLIPEEMEPPPVVRYLQEGISRRRRQTSKEPFWEVVVDPDANRIHLEIIRRKPAGTATTIERSRRLRELALEAGPAALSDSEKGFLLRDAQSMAALHRQVHSIRDPHRAAPLGLTRGSINDEPRSANR